MCRLDKYWPSRQPLFPAVRRPVSLCSGGQRQWSPVAVKTTDFGSERFRSRPTSVVILHVKVSMLVTQLYSTVCLPRDCIPPGSSVQGIFQARILEWVDMSFSRGIFLTHGSNSGLLHCRQILYHLRHQGSPSVEYLDINST